MAPTRISPGTSCRPAETIRRMRSISGSFRAGGPASLSIAGTACRNWHSPLLTLRKIDQHDIRVFASPIEDDVLAVGADVEATQLT